jgi:predicted nucleic acid-binding protein
MIERRTLLRGIAATTAVTTLGRPRPAGAEPPPETTRTSPALRRLPRRSAYLIDTDVISELCKKDQANTGVVAFFKEVSSRDTPLYLAAATIGELRRGVELIRYRGDTKQAQTLERWLSRLLADYRDNVLSFDEDVVCGCRTRRALSTSRSRPRR